MTPAIAPEPLLQGVNTNDYNVNNIDDEIRVDRLCVDLLRHLYQDLTQAQHIEPEQAGTHCRGADYFLREFIVAERCENIFQIEAIRVRQFAGHWYIIRTPEPNMVELKEILAGTAEFYTFLSRQRLIDEATAKEIEAHCQDLPFYQKRIEEFWAIEDGGFDKWRQNCPL